MASIEILGTVENFSTVFLWVLMQLSHVRGYNLNGYFENLASPGFQNN